MLRELGAKTSKQLPPGWSDGNSDVVPITANVGSRANDRSDGDFDPRAPEQRRLAWE
jgi:hypothetical protein